MQSFRQIYIFSIFIVFNTIVSVNQWSILPIGNTFITWTINTIILLFLVKELWLQRSLILKRRYLIVTLFLIWALIGSIRGFFVADNYWEYKQLVEGTFCLLLPLFTFAFADDEITITVLKKWNKWMVPLFFLFFILVLRPTEYHFLIWPIFFYGIFAYYLPKTWRIGILLIFVAMVTVGLSSRAQLLKVVATMLLAGAFYFNNYWIERLVRCMHWMFYVGSISLLFLGITGRFNVFESMQDKEGVYTETRVNSDGNVVVDDASADTRTFIYQEVISSAIIHDYVWIGRTPARGNDSFFFGEKIAEELGTDKYERHNNEVCHPNVFTWLGLIGMLLYCFIYLQASWLATYRSNSYALKILGCFVAFHWALGWIEDQNRFDVSNVFMWMCIAICLSERFRSLNDDDFLYWFYCIFYNEEYIPYDEIEEDYNNTETNEQE